MELYTLDPKTLLRVDVVDRFESLIWTERFSSYGDFELVIRADDSARKLLQAGTRVTVNNSYRVGTIEETETKLDSEGRSLLTIKGPHLESILNDRTTRPVVSGAPAKITYTNVTPTTILRNLFASICVSNTTILEDKIPLYSAGSLYPADTIPEPADIVASYEVPNDTLYNIFNQIAEAYGFGFRLYRGLDDQKLYFNVYTGADRTSKQTTLPSVIFSPSLDTLGEVSDLVSIAGSKNVAYVYHPLTSAVIYGQDGVLSGFDRRVLNVDASDINLTASTGLDAALLQRGKDELLKYRGVRAIDGQIPQNTIYKYGVDYNLGDLVEMRSEEGVTNYMRVSEHIYASDEQGDRSYPTLAQNIFIVPGSWNAFDVSTTWDSVSPTATWDTI